MLLHSHQLLLQLQLCPLATCFIQQGVKAPLLFELQHQGRLRGVDGPRLLRVPLAQAPSLWSVFASPQKSVSVLTFLK